MSSDRDTVGAAQTFPVKTQPTTAGGQTCAPPRGSLGDCRGDMLMLLQERRGEKERASSFVRVGLLHICHVRFRHGKKIFAHTPNEDKRR